VVSGCPIRIAAKLIPILQEMGITAKPSIFEIYNIIEGR